MTTGSSKAAAAAGSARDFRIERIEAFGVAVPLVGEGFKNAYTTKKVQKSVIVRMTSAGGATGLGNIDPSPGYSEETVEASLAVIRNVLAPAATGMDASNVHVLLDRMDAVQPAFLDAKAAIEMACTDLVARACGLPVHTWLGGAVRDRVSFNAWIGILSPDEAAAEAKRWYDRGFRSAKIKVGGGIEADRDRVLAVRAAVGDGMQLRIDANAGYSADESIRLAHMVSGAKLQLFEQPVPADDLAGMARVRREGGGVPVMADESVLDHASLLAIIRADAADLVKLKVMKQGGFLRARRMLETASAAGLRVVIGHGFGLGVNTVAEIMMAATSDAVIDGLECVGPLKTADDIVTRKLDLTGGSIPLPGGPGLGVELDADKLAAYRFD
ncbi:MAG: dipeptide epimerase [Betaproteobacteria bacterium]|nr:dipeptide epimerase [Betaproteobacteria bacterium]